MQILKIHVHEIGGGVQFFNLKVCNRPLCGPVIGVWNSNAAPLGNPVFSGKFDPLSRNFASSVFRGGGPCWANCVRGRCVGLELQQY
jgi:hypothetical protein